MLAVAAALIALATPSVPLVAAGDVASCRSTGDEATALLLDRLPGTIALLGDSVYERGSADEFRRCFSWSRHKARIRPAVGNHEYLTPGARGYFAYFRVPQWYSYELGDWHVVVLNSNCGPAGGCGPDSPQARWLRADLAEHPARCTLAYAHHPRFSSGVHGSDRTLAALWRIMSAGGVDVYLAGHDHHYERFAPSGGIRQFVVGTGGRSLYAVVRRLAGSRAAQTLSYGLLALSLRPEGYSWRFVPVAGRYRDAGGAACR
ncbi:MAG: metallophosphoesterase [Gaiellaceae bacterium]